MHQNADSGSRLYMYTKNLYTDVLNPGCMCNYVQATKFVNIYL